MCWALLKSDSSSVYTAPDSVDLDEHNLGNTMMERQIHAQVGGIFDMFVDEVDLVRITFSCHFDLDLLCEEGAHDSA